MDAAYRRLPQQRKERQALVPGEWHFGENVLLLAEKNLQDGAGAAAPEFAELHSFRPVSPIAASLEISGVNVQVYAGADELTLSALFHALSSC